MGLLVLQMLAVVSVTVGIIVFMSTTALRRRRVVRRNYARLRQLLPNATWHEPHAGRFLFKGTAVEVRYADLETDSRNFLAKDEIAFSIDCRSFLSCFSHFGFSLTFNRRVNSLFRVFESRHCFQVQNSGISINALGENISGSMLRRTFDQPAVCDILLSAFDLGCCSFSLIDSRLLISIPYKHFISNKDTKLLEDICSLLIALRDEIDPNPAQAANNW